MMAGGILRMNKIEKNINGVPFYWIPDGDMDVNFKINQFIYLCIGGETTYNSLDEMEDQYNDFEKDYSDERIICKMIRHKSDPGQSIYVGKYQILDFYTGKYLKRKMKLEKL